MTRPDNLAYRATPGQMAAAWCWARSRSAPFNSWGVTGIRVLCERLRDPTLLFLRHVKAGVVHTKRREDPLLQKRAERLA